MLYWNHWCEPVFVIKKSAEQSVQRALKNVSLFVPVNADSSWQWMQQIHQHLARPIQKLFCFYITSVNYSNY